jgi:LEA14-like dessication related protein
MLVEVVTGRKTENESDSLILNGIQCIVYMNFIKIFAGNQLDLVLISMVFFDC